MEPILKFRELLPGKYTVNSYEPTKSSFGNTHIIYATHESKEEIKFYSNVFLSDYIISKKPTKKFDIEFVNGRVNIIGYSRIVNLV